jgi:hypothetical protein
MDPDKIPPELWKQMNISREDFESVMARQAEREKSAPPAGTVAPDFELKRLDDQGRLSEETLRLSALRGRPVGVIFGSYT